MSCADVCITFDFEAENSFYHEEIVTARKQHRCCECGSSIVPRQQYQRASGRNRGGVFTAKTCTVCVEIRAAFVCGSWIFGDLWLSMREEMFPVWKRLGPYDCLAKLTTQPAIDLCMAEFKDWLAEEGD